MILVRNLCKYFQQTAAVMDVSFEVKEGETLVLLGTSGSGKTSTLRMINRLIEPSAGEIFINGKNTLEQPLEVLRRSIGYVLQSNGLFPHYTVAQNIGIVPQLLGWDKQSIKSRTIELLIKLHLDPDRDFNRYPRELSGGQQQRVGLARALASNPPILLMDEPFGALDPVTRNSIRQEFLALDELKRKTIIMVTHDVEEAFLLGDKICLMDAGKIQQMGTPAELLFNPANDFSRNFFGSDRLLLEMKATKISDIWNSLINAKDEHNENAQYVAYEDNLWVVMERLTERSYQTINVRKHNEIKVVTLPGILNALSQLKTTT
jgi:osmoprotectant transport system ATP-binding protein